MFLLAHDQHRTCRRSDNAFGRAAYAKVFPPGVSVCRNHDKIDIESLAASTISMRRHSLPQRGPCLFKTRRLRPSSATPADSSQRLPVFFERCSARPAQFNKFSRRNRLEYVEQNEMRAKLFRETKRVLKSFSGRRRKLCGTRIFFNAKVGCLGSSRRLRGVSNFIAPKMLCFPTLRSSVLGKKCAFLV